MNNDKVLAAQSHLRESGADGWLLYDFRGNNDLTRRFLEMSRIHTSRRFFYWIPAFGEPVKLVHAIEAQLLDAWPGAKHIYLSWQSLQRELREILNGAKKIAMEYSPENAIPTVSKVDAGTIDLIRSLGYEVVSSGDFLPHFTAVIDESQAESHIRAGQALDSIASGVWEWIAGQLKRGKVLCEYEVQQKILSDFGKAQLVTVGSPLVSVNAHSADPHYTPQPEGSSPIRKGDFLLIDLWCKERGEQSIFADISRVAVVDQRASAQQQEIFQIVRKAQKAAVDLVKSRFASRQRLEGREVDDAARNVIRQAGYGDHFLHRTGHSIEVQLHGSGANLDNFETADRRPLLLGSCFSVEPGIYLPGEFGVRLEHDLYVDREGKVQITGGIQEELVVLY